MTIMTHIRRNCIPGLIFFAGFVGCAGSMHPREVMPGSQDSAVYAALVDSLFRRGASDTLFVSDSTITFRVPSDANRPPIRQAPWPTPLMDTIRGAWWRTFDAMPRELMVRLGNVSATREPIASLALPLPVHRLTRTELREIFQLGPFGGWREFDRRYPRARGYSSFTRIVYPSDDRQALVYYEYHCGGLCGGGNLVLLTRGDDRSWHVSKVLMLWIS